MYTIVHSQEQIEQFAKLFTPDAKEHAIVFQTFARRKYCPKLPKSEYLINRTIVSGDSTPSKVYRQLLKLQVPCGAYVDHNETPIPIGSTVTYCLIRPKNMIKALTTTMSYMVDSLSGDPGSPMRDPLGLYKKNIGISHVPDSNKLMQIDLDSKDPTLLQNVQNLFVRANLKPLIIIETRGGFHIVYRKTPNINHAELHFFKQSTLFIKPNVNGKMVKDYYFSVTNEPNVAVPGTWQGDFKVRICDKLV